jgi:hypothetical protein
LFQKIPGNQLAKVLNGTIKLIPADGGGREFNPGVLSDGVSLVGADATTRPHATHHRKAVGSNGSGHDELIARWSSASAEGASAVFVEINV